MTISSASSNPPDCSYIISTTSSCSLFSSLFFFTEMLQTMNNLTSDWARCHFLKQSNFLTLYFKLSASRIFSICFSKCKYGVSVEVVVVRKNTKMYCSHSWIVYWFSCVDWGLNSYRDMASTCSRQTATFHFLTKWKRKNNRKPLHSINTAQKSKSILKFFLPDS